MRPAQRGRSTRSGSSFPRRRLLRSRISKTPKPKRFIAPTSSRSMLSRSNQDNHEKVESYDESMALLEEGQAEAQAAM